MINYFKSMENGQMYSDARVNVEIKINSDAGAIYEQESTHSRY